MVRGKGLFENSTLSARAQWLYVGRISGATRRVFRVTRLDAKGFGGSGSSHRRCDPSEDKLYEARACLNILALRAVALKERAWALIADC